MNETIQPYLVYSVQSRPVSTANSDMAVLPETVSPPSHHLLLMDCEIVTAQESITFEDCW